MASVEKIILFNSAISANGTTNSDSQSLPINSNDFVLHTMVSSYAAGNFTVTLQDTSDGGTTWHDIVAAAAISANASEIDVNPRPIMSKVRAQIVGAGGADGTVLVELHYSPKK